MFTIAPGTRAVGLQLPIQAHSSLFAADWERDAGRDELARIAQACDELGYAYIGICDHVAIPEAWAATMGTQWMDPIATLAWLAAQTQRVMLLTHVYVLPLRQPELAAKQFATLDHLSAGRMICGIGAGHVEAEFVRLGVDFARRGASLDERLPVLAQALEQEFVDGLGARPRPVQRPRPPIWVGGSSAAAARRAARLGDGWLPQGPATDDHVGALLRERDALGLADQPFAIGHITPRVYVGEPSWNLGPGAIVGAADAVAEALVGSAPSTVNQFQVRLQARSADEFVDQLAAFAAGVMPLISSTR